MKVLILFFDKKRIMNVPECLLGLIRWKNKTASTGHGSYCTGHSAVGFKYLNRLEMILRSVPQMEFFKDIRKKESAQKEILMAKFKNFVLELKIRGYSEKTIEIYLYYNNKFLDFIKKEPRSISSADIKLYLNQILLKNAQPRTMNMAINSLKAYYESFMGKRLFKNIKRSKTPKNIPNVLSKDEIDRLIGSAGSLKHKLLIELLYSSGIRVSECVKLKVDEIDINSRIIYVKEGKGKKDRFTITSKRFIEDLDMFLSSRAKLPYLFDDGYMGHITIRTAEMIVKQAAKKADLSKNVHPHLLRACFATHLMENGTSIEKVQKLLGHSRIETTKGYIKTRTDDLKRIISPLDI